MKKALQGHWVASVITGVMVAVIGFLISQASENRGVWAVVFLALAIILALGIALLLDRAGGEKMANAEKIPENQNPISAIHLEDCENAVVADNVVQGDIGILTAKRVTDLRASGNRKEK